MSNAAPDASRFPVGEELAWVEGRITPSRDARVPLQDRGFLFAEAAYEACVGRGARVFAWAEHQLRLARTLAGIGLPSVPATLKQVECVRNDLVAAFGAGTFLLYLQVTGGVAPRNHVMPVDPEPAVYATIRPFDRGIIAKEQARGLAVVTCEDHRWDFATYKTTQLLWNVQAKKKARAAGADDVIFFAKDGTGLEGASTNFFWVEQGCLFTPPLARNLLPGITRELIGRDFGLEVIEAEAPLARILAADEVMLTGTTRDATAVISIDGRQIADGRPGPVARALASRFAALFDSQCP